MPSDKLSLLGIIALVGLGVLPVLWTLMRGKPLGKLFGWLLLAFLVLLLVLFFWGVPVQTKLVCEFDDGDQMVVRQKYKYQALAMLGRQHPMRSVGYSRVYYKPKGRMEGWKEIGGINLTSNRLQSCSNIRKMDGVISVQSRYRLPGSDWQGIPLFPIEEWSELEKKMKEMNLRRRAGISFTQIGVSTLLREDPLVHYLGCYPFKERNDHPVCGVQAVIQSYSHDGGQTWSKMELTEDSKLYELGKPLFEQKGVARPVDWTGKK